MTQVRDAVINGEISYTRQTGWYDPADRQDKVTVIGNGGIGSPLALALAKLGVPKITLIDDDVINRWNLPNQMFALDTVGQSKAEALKSVCEAFSNSEVEAITERVDGSWPQPAGPNGIVISGVDSMAARKSIWEHVKMKPYVDLYLDARLGGELVRVDAIRPCNLDDIAMFETYSLYSDEQAREDVCGQQAIIDVVFACAALLTRMVRKFLAGEEIERQIQINMNNLSVFK